MLQLDFADDFFAALRAFYNDRAQHAALKRLTFVLLGAVAPQDLIQDRATPFNDWHAHRAEHFTCRKPQAHCRLAPL